MADPADCIYLCRPALLNPCNGKSSGADTTAVQDAMWPSHSMHSVAGPQLAL